ncbi:hypothetical protein [uncultured Bacteroides sp.]|uniref:hypothetical protein n=1 Tax=uncultured Bacteroides sp. TaxID=162156 RepID=UPI002AAB47E1|nr:hypothetical protein [uncultured Bacteroides sp.]
MKAKLIVAIWVISFVGMAITSVIHWIPFILCFLVFACASIYMGKHEKRLIRELKLED